MTGERRHAHRLIHREAQAALGRGEQARKHPGPEPGKCSTSFVALCSLAFLSSLSMWFTPRLMALHGRGNACSPASLLSSLHLPLSRAAVTSRSYCHVSPLYVASHTTTAPPLPNTTRIHTGRQWPPSSGHHSPFTLCTLLPLAPSSRPCGLREPLLSALPLQSSPPLLLLCSLWVRRTTFAVGFAR